jgi:hypothetical protein
VNDCQTQGALAEGLDKISFLLLRYEMVERIYLHKVTRAKGLLRSSLVKLYTAILVYIAKALKYYSESTAKRLGKSIAEGRTRVQNVLDQVSIVESDVDSVRRDIDAECQCYRLRVELIADAIVVHETSFNTLLNLPKQLQNLWSGLRDPIVRIGEQLSDIQDHLNGK